MQRNGLEQLILLRRQRLPASDLSAAHVAKAPLLHHDHRALLAFAFLEQWLEPVDVIAQLFGYLVGVAQHQRRIGLFMRRLLEFRHLATCHHGQPLLRGDGDRRAGQRREKAIELGQVQHRVIVAVGDQQVFEAVEFFFAEGG